MYVPTPANLALRAAAAGLVASVLGRVKEFTTLFAQAGLMRFDTARFVSAVASRNSSGGSNPLAGVNNAGKGNNISSFLGGGGGDDGEAAAASATRTGSGSPPHPDSSGAAAFSGGGSGGNGAGSAAGQEESAVVVVGGAADDGSSAEGGAGDGGHLWGVPGGAPAAFEADQEISAILTRSASGDASEKRKNSGPLFRFGIVSWRRSSNNSPKLSCI